MLVAEKKKRPDFSDTKPGECRFYSTGDDQRVPHHSQPERTGHSLSVISSSSNLAVVMALSKTFSKRGAD
jgi:hypothetical protein